MIDDKSKLWRSTTQFLLPLQHEKTPLGTYDIYPTHSLGSEEIRSGYDALAEIIAQAGETVVIDGYPGMLWSHFQYQLQKSLEERGIQVAFQNVEEAFLPPDEIDRLISPYLGGDDPLFGFRFPGSLADFFNPLKLAELQPVASKKVNILFGTGAALAGWQGTLIYVDVPKNEIQFRARAKTVKNLGAAQALDPKPAYKRSYFVDWAAANRHKAALLPRIDWVVDGQRPDTPTMATGSALRSALARMARTVFRVRPWFEPGPWGGQWIKKNISQLNSQVVNYAWSFELISPENGLLFESDGLLLEVSFDMLMFQEHRAVLGECAPNFGYEFPIRYDFLDTVDGGNLSVQCHPRPGYIRANFGETYTQDECYYILDCFPGKRVYLGFQDGVDPVEWESALLHSTAAGEALEIDRYVQSLPAHKHDLFLIPNGTIHGSGEGNLVLEISATPYIFTFKMYDWLRMDLDGKPRSLNIERAMQNLYFDRQGERIPREFVSQPYIVEEGRGWKLLHLPSHPNHFYDIHRYEFSGLVDVSTGGETGSCHVLSLVEGQAVLLETQDGARARFNYLETFVVPAAAGQYRLVSENGELIKVVKTFVKPKPQWAPGVVPGA